MPRVSIVVVTYNSASEIGGCLDSLAGIPDVEIIVVDNASRDATRDQVNRRGVRLIPNPNNAGFAAAVNQGVRATAAPLVLLLNPDVRLIGGLDALAAEFGDPRTGAASGLLINADGTPQTGFTARNLPSPAALVFEVLGINRLWPGNPANWHYRCLGLDPVTPGLVEQPPGAFLMFSRQTWERVGGFDERFWPVWFEDVDFCAKLKAAGLLVRFNPVAAAVHAGGHSVGALTLEIREQYWYGSLLEYASKYYSPLAFRAVCFAVALGVAFRAVLLLPFEGVKAFAVYGAVCRLAAGRFFRLRRDP